MVIPIGISQLCPFNTQPSFLVKYASFLDNRFARMDQADAWIAGREFESREPLQEEAACSFSPVFPFEGDNWHFICLWVCYDSGLTDTTLSKLALLTNGRYLNLIAPYHPTPEP